MASPLDDRGYKRFSGEDDDAGKQLRKFKAWAQAKMATMKDFQATQHGPWIYTLLDGKALESVEHVTLEELQKEGGAAMVWALLQERFPEKESEDQMGEALGECFGLCAKEGESMQQWAARVQEVFQKCRRKASVEFPSVAQGWIALNCSGLTEEQKAIVKAKTQGKLELSVITAALRSCFRQFRASAKARKPVSTLLVETEGADDPGAEEGDNLNDPFADVEAFLADHDISLNVTDAYEVDEGEAAEALAVSWRERRQEINKLQKSRRFGQAASSRKSFRVEIEELKKRTRCRKCNRLGHWARECRSTTNARGKDQHGASSSSTQVPGISDVNLVQTAGPNHELDYEHEVSFVGVAELLSNDTYQEEVLSSGLISSPGYGIVDSGCGRTLIGRQTLEKLSKLLSAHTDRVIEEYDSNSSFRFGNGAKEDSSRAVRIPVGIGHRLGIIDAAVISGRAPLLLGRPTLERMQVVLDFSQKCMKFLGQDNPIPMHSNSAGQLLIDVLTFPPRTKEPSAPRESLSCESTQQSMTSQCKESRQSSSTPSVMTSPSEAPTLPPSCSPESPKCDQSNPTTKPPPDEHPATVCRRRRKLTLKPKECRCLLSQIKHLQCAQESQIAVAELFSEPRVTLKAQQCGATGIAFDVKQGCDLLDPQTQQEVSGLLQEAKPSLLTASPPCTHGGGWEHLNRCYRTAVERARIVRQSRQQLRFCVQEIHAQIRRGGKWLFEHPLGSSIWKTPEMKSLIRKYGFHKICVLMVSSVPNPRSSFGSVQALFALITRRLPGMREFVLETINTNTTKDP